MTTQQFKTDILPLSRSMWRVAFAILGDSDQASDAVQECMLRLWKSRGRLAEVENVDGYCIGAVRNIAISMVASRKISADIDGMDDILPSGDDHNRMDWSDALTAVDRAIGSLPPNQREAIRLSSYGGMSNAEIAETMGITNDNVRALLSRGRNKLKSLFSNILQR